MLHSTIQFPKYSGAQCLMMPYIQGDPDSVPHAFQSYRDIIKETFLKQGDVGYLTIDESFVQPGKAQRSYRSTTSRAIHTEAGKRPYQKIYVWGGGWAKSDCVLLDADTEILLANNIDDSCAIWDASHFETSVDGDIGPVSHLYPMEHAIFVKAGDVHKIGILTPHESLPISQGCYRQFIRIISSGVHGAEPYFTKNPLFQEVK